MCYDVASKTKADLRYALLRGGDQARIDELTRKLEKLQGKVLYHASGFSHPQLLVFTNDKPMEPQLFTWGLIPQWVKDEKTAFTMWNKTLNARDETIFEKPSWRESAKNKRCLIYLDAFYEHHHFGKQTYPFRIERTDGEPFAVAGLWEEWENKTTGELKQTVAIVTTEANPLMAKIHNNTEAESGRMPVILPNQIQDAWLAPCKTDADKKHLNDLMVPFDQSQLTAHTVGRLRGKAAVGNKPEAAQELKYEELLFDI